MFEMYGNFVTFLSKTWTYTLDKGVFVPLAVCTYFWNIAKSLVWVISGRTLPTHKAVRPSGFPGLSNIKQRYVTGNMQSQ